MLLRRFSDLDQGDCVSFNPSTDIEPSSEKKPMFLLLPLLESKKLCLRLRRRVVCFRNFPLLTIFFPNLSIYLPREYQLCPNRSSRDSFLLYSEKRSLPTPWTIDRVSSSSSWHWSGEEGSTGTPDRDSKLTGLNATQHRPPVSSLQPSTRFPGWPCPPWTLQFQVHSGFPCDPSYPWSTFLGNPSSNPRGVVWETEVGIPTQRVRYWTIPKGVTTCDGFERAQFHTFTIIINSIPCFTQVCLIGILS
jgi:hypothetical protein